MSEPAMGEKDIYIERLSLQLEEWKAEILVLENQAEEADEHMEKAASAIKGAIGHIRTMIG